MTLLLSRLARLRDAAPAPVRAPASAPARAPAFALASAPEAGTEAAAAPEADVAFAPAPDAHAERLARLRSLIARTIARHPAPVPALRARAPDGPLPGSIVDTPHGPLHLVTRTHDVAHAHGRARVAPALSVPSATLAALALDPTLLDVTTDRALYLDTETTGLAGGTGTIPFLVGLAAFRGGALVVDQLFLRSPGEEAPILRALADRLAEASCLVTYNGKSFDWPLLRTRFVLARVACPPLPAHVDLLHCARRVLKHRMAARGVSMRLVEVERTVLGLHREDDIEGAEVPAAYLAWLRHGATERLAAVLEHNAQDLVALPATLAALAERWSLRDEDDATEHLALAELAWRARDFDRARRFAELARDGAGDAALRDRGAHWATRAEKRLARDRRKAERLEQARRKAERLEQARQRVLAV